MHLQEIIKDLWNNKDKLDSIVEQDKARALVAQAIEKLDSGEIRVAQVVNDEVVVHEWVKQAILLYFKIQSMTKYEVGPFEFLDKIPLKENYANMKVRAVPGAIAR